MTEQNPFKNGRYVLGQLVFNEIKKNIISLKIAVETDNSDMLGTDEFQWFQDIAEKVIELSKTLQDQSEG